MLYTGCWCTGCCGTPVGVGEKYGLDTKGVGPGLAPPSVGVGAKYGLDMKGGDPGLVPPLYEVVGVNDPN